MVVPSANTIVLFMFSAWALNISPGTSILEQSPARDRVMKKGAALA